MSNIYAEQILITDAVFALSVQCATLRHCTVKRRLWRTVCAGIICGVLSAVAAIVPVLQNGLYYALELTVVFAIGFAGKGFCKCTVTALLITFVCGGAAYAIRCACNTQDGTAPNAFAAAASSCACLLYRPAATVKITLHTQYGCCTLKALKDSGNLLTEPVTGLPVIAVNASATKSILPKSVLFALGTASNTDDTPIYPVTYTSAGANGVAYCFIPCAAYIQKGIIKKKLHCAVAPMENLAVDALINTQMPIQ